MDRDMCANCGHWREEHYNNGAAGGPYIADKLFGCHEYQGSVPTAERRKEKDGDLEAFQEARRQYFERA